MKLEVGMYIRCSKGNIEKIDYLVEQDNPIFPYTINCTPRFRSDIKKANHNIIKLLEVGDYVNGHMVYEVKKNCVMIGYQCFPTELNPEEEILYQTVYENDIKTILTHEQFEREVYKVE